MFPLWNQNGTRMEPQYSIEEISREEDSRVKGSIGEDSETQNTTHTSPSFYGKYQNVILSADDLETLKNDFPDDYNKRIEKLSAYMQSTGKTYQNHLVTIQYWAEQDKEKQKNETQTRNAPSGSNPFLNMARDKGLI